jgi:hypothetical protein
MAEQLAELYKDSISIGGLAVWEYVENKQRLWECMSDADKQRVRDDKRAIDDGKCYVRPMCEYENAFLNLSNPLSLGHIVGLGNNDLKYPFVVPAGSKFCVEQSWLSLLAFVLLVLLVPLGACCLLHTGIYRIGGLQTIQKDNDKVLLRRLDRDSLDTVEVVEKNNLCLGTDGAESDDTNPNRDTMVLVQDKVSG